MLHWLACLGVLWSSVAPATPQLELEVRLDPASRQFNAMARIADERGVGGFDLGPEFEITALTVDGRPIKPEKRVGRSAYVLPAGGRRVEIAYHATLNPLAVLDHRQVLGDRSATASPEGSFLPAAAGWYPELGQNFTYRLSLALPAGQKGLAAGELVNESDGADGYRASFVVADPIDGIDLMAGPYIVGERSLKLPGGPNARVIRLRTWFHPDIASLSSGYLDDSARYIERYSRLIGDYPFAMFSVVSSPTPTGLGMPGLTYLGRDVLKLPFIRATSLGHEVLHNWWGNSVYPDWKSGNWSEGLTTFLADYAYKEDESETAARDMRLGWLRDLAAVPAAEETALKDFSSRRHGISSIVGYGKSAMVFLMLRDAIGKDAFERGLRLLWQRKRFQTATWSDLEATFAEVAGHSLTDFFRQWVQRRNAPKLALKSAERAGEALTLRLSGGDNYTLDLPLRLTFADRSEMRPARLVPGETRVTIKSVGDVRAVELDPDYRLWRRVDASLLPPILREVFVAPRVGLVLAGDDPDVRSAALALSARLLDVKPALIERLPDSGAALIVGTNTVVDAWLVRQGLAPRPEGIRGRGSAQVWAGRDERGHPFAVVTARDAAALAALERGLPHYGKQSWLVFDGGQVTDKGTWPAKAEPLRVTVPPAPDRLDP
jgi:hypothetical protein